MPYLKLTPITKRIYDVDPTITILSGSPSPGIYINIGLVRLLRIKSGQVFRVFADRENKRIKLIKVPKKYASDNSCVTCGNADGNVAPDKSRRLKVSLRRHFEVLNVSPRESFTVDVLISKDKKTLTFSYERK